MPKTQEELNKLIKEYEALNNKLKELTDDELIQVTGGGFKVLEMTYSATGGCGVTNQIREYDNKYSQRFICNFMNVECQYR